MFQLGEFIRLTGNNCDVVILTGDLNTQPQEIGHKVLTSLANRSDAWTARVSRFHIIMTSNFFNVIISLCVGERFTRQHEFKPN